MAAAQTTLAGTLSQELAGYVYGAHAKDFSACFVEDYATPAPLFARGWKQYSTKGRKDPPRAGEPNCDLLYHGTRPSSLISLLRCGILPKGCATCDDQGAQKVIDIRNGTVGGNTSQPPFYGSPSLGVASMYAQPFLDEKANCIVQVVVRLVAWTEPSAKQGNTLSHIWDANSMGFMSPGMQDQNVEWLYGQANMPQLEIVGILVRTTKIDSWPHFTVPRGFDPKLGSAFLHIMWTHKSTCNHHLCSTTMALIASSLKAHVAHMQSVGTLTSAVACIFHSAEATDVVAAQGIELAVCLAKTGGDHCACDPKGNKAARTTKVQGTPHPTLTQANKPESGGCAVQ